MCQLRKIVSTQQSLPLGDVSQPFLRISQLTSDRSSPALPPTASPHGIRKAKRRRSTYCGIFATGKLGDPSPFTMPVLRITSHLGLELASILNNQVLSLSYLMSPTADSPAQFHAGPLPLVMSTFALPDACLLSRCRAGQVTACGV